MYHIVYTEKAESDLAISIVISQRTALNGLLPIFREWKIASSD